jgi:hypothetical protein
MKILIALALHINLAFGAGFKFPMPDRYLTVGEFKKNLSNETQTIKAGILVTLTNNFMNIYTQSFLKEFLASAQIYSWPALTEVC